MQAGARKLGEGDLASRIPVRTGDEIGALATHFNIMAGRIQESQETLEGKVEERTADLASALETQTATAGILKAIAASPADVSPVLQAIVDSACEVCGAYDAAVLLKDGDDLRFSAHRGPIPIGLDKWPINRTWTAGRAFIDQKPVHIHDLMSVEGEEFPDGRELSLRMGHRTILSVPLLHRGESVGALVVRRSEVQPFDEKQITLLTTFADQAVIAIENTRLFNETQEALARQTASADILKVIASSPSDVQPVYNSIVEAAVRLLACDIAYVQRTEGSVIVPVAGATPTGGAELSPPYPNDPEHNFPSRAINSKSILHLPDWSKIELPPHEKRIHERGIQSCLYLPLMRADECLGLLIFARKRPQEFLPKQIAVAEILP